MAKKPDTPCAGGCGRLLWSGSASLPAGQRRCQDCRRAAVASATQQRCGRCKHTLPLATFTPSSRNKSGAWCQPCRTDYMRKRYCMQSGSTVRPPVCDDCGDPTSRGSTAYGRFCTRCAKDRKRARESRKVSLRRTVQRFTDITAAYERDLRSRTWHCPLCGTWMTGEPGHPNSKQLDHIVPICIGGTHTMGNVRIICRTCNLTRPKDGSDVTDGQLARWTRDARLVEEIRARIKTGRERKACRCGRPMAKQSCPNCPVRLEERRQRRELGREAARMRADGCKWREISEVLGIAGTGSAYAMAWQYGEPDVKAKWPRDQGWGERKAV